MYTRAITPFGEFPYDPSKPCDNNTQYWDSNIGKCMPFTPEVPDLPTATKVMAAKKGLPVTTIAIAGAAVLVAGMFLLRKK